MRNCFLGFFWWPCNIVFFRVRFLGAAIAQLPKGPNVNLVSFPKWWLNSWHIFEPQTLEVTSHFWGSERVAACRPRPTTRCSVPMYGGATAVLQWRVDPSKTTQRRGLHVLDLEGGAFFFCWGDCKGFRSSLGRVSGHHLGWNLKNPNRTFKVSWSDWEHIILDTTWMEKETPTR